MARHALAIVGASRPRPGEVANGDAWTVESDDGGWRISVIDGLGHGPEAEAAAVIALDTLATQPSLPPDRALEICHRRLAGSRGAAISIVGIDVSAGLLTFCGVGNVEGRLILESHERRLTAQRGIVGATLPRLRPLDFPLQGDWLLLLHTDGVSARFHIDALRPMGERGLQSLADEILAGWARADDDATIVVAQTAPEYPGPATARVS